MNFSKYTAVLVLSVEKPCGQPVECKHNGEPEVGKEYRLPRNTEEDFELYFFPSSSKIPSFEAGDPCVSVP